MALATKKLLAQSLKSLLEKKPLNKITVKEIAENCGVNRQTFYYNFQDIYDLVEWIFQTDAADLFGENPTYENWKEYVQVVTEYLRKNENLVRNAMQSINRSSLEQFLKAQLRPILESIVVRKIQDAAVSQEDRDFIIDVYVLSAIGILFDWMGGGMKDEYDIRLEKLVRLLDGSLDYVIDEFSQTGSAS